MTYIPVFVLLFFWGVQTLIAVHRGLTRKDEAGATFGFSLSVGLSLVWLWAIVSVTSKG